MWHPWRTLRALAHVDLHWTKDLPVGVLGATDGRHIWMDDRQLQVERRSTLAHELAHLHLEHTGGCGPREEDEARALAARWLIDMDSLLDALAWSEHLEEVADELWVDLDTLYARLDTLTGAERAAIRELHSRTEGGA